MNLSRNELSVLCDMAKSAALSAGQYIQSQFDKNYVSRSKTGGDSLASQVVTEVDFQAQEIILCHLSESLELYHLGLLTEESTDDQSRLQKDYFWCIDPLDGTLPFTEHRTGYAVSIALVSKEGNPVVGVVYIPDLEDMYSAFRGSGVFVNDVLSKRQRTDDSTIHFYMDRSFQSEPYYQEVRSAFEAHFVDTGVAYHADYGGVRNAIGVMTSDKACYFKFPKMPNGCGSIWDYAATRLLVEETGLYVSNAVGDPLWLNDPYGTFMNRQGILYATDREVVELVMGLAEPYKIE